MLIYIKNENDTSMSDQMIRIYIRKIRFLISSWRKLIICFLYGLLWLLCILYVLDRRAFIWGQLLICVSSFFFLFWLLLLAGLKALGSEMPSQVLSKRTSWPNYTSQAHTNDVLHINQARIHGRHYVHFFTFRNQTGECVEHFNFVLRAGKIRWAQASQEDNISIIVCNFSFPSPTLKLWKISKTRHQLNTQIESYWTMELPCFLGQ